MALRFVDSFEPYSAAQMPKKWTLAAGQTITTGRNGNCVSLTAGPGVMSKTLDYQPSWIVGFAFQLPSAGSVTQLYVNTALDVSHAIDILATLSLESDSTLTLRSGTVGSGAIIGNTSGLIEIKVGVWYYIEVEISLSGTSPISVTGTVRVNGNQVITGTGATTINSSSIVVNAAKSNAHTWNAGSSTILIDDLYIFDTTGSVNNVFAGDIKLIAIYPNGDVTTQWTPSTAGTHFSLINENPPDDDSSYIKSNTVAQFDNFTWQSIPGFTGTVQGVQYSIYARKDDEGTRTIKHTVGPTGSLQLSGPQIFLSDTYAYYLLEMDLDPNGNIPWTQANFNSKNFGVELFS